MEFIDGTLVDLGYEQITSLGGVKSLNPPVGATSALVSVETKGVRWRSGVNPTTSIGNLLAAGTPFYFTQNLSALRFIEIEASAVLNVNYYRKG